MIPLCLDLPSLAKALRLSETTIKLLPRSKDSDFPKPRVLSGRRVGWLMREVSDWLEARPVSDNLPPPNTDDTKSRFSPMMQQCMYVVL